MFNPDLCRRRRLRTRPRAVHFDALDPIPDDNIRVLPRRVPWPKKRSTVPAALTAVVRGRAAPSATACSSSRERRMRPLVREMDEHAKMPRDLIDELFDARRDGHRDPRGLRRRRAARFFHAVLAVEALSQVDPSVGVLVDVQNTLVINALLRWGSEAHEGSATSRARAAGPSAPTRCRRPGAGSDAFALATRAVGTGDGFALNGRKLWITNGNEADLFIVFANVNPAGGLPRHHGVPRRARHSPGFTVGQEGRQAGHPREQHVRAASSRTAASRPRTCSARSARATRSPSRR